MNPVPPTTGEGMAEGAAGDGLAMGEGLVHYPVPVSPLPPPHSNEIERRRADRAEAFFRELESGIRSLSMPAQEPPKGSLAVENKVEKEDDSVDSDHHAGHEVATDGLVNREGGYAFNAPARFPQILYEDDAILALNKPAGLYCHHAAELMERFLQQRTEKGEETRREERTSKPQPLTMVHRLDRDTSGVMLLAKTPGAAASLGREFARHTPQKTYVALGTLQSGSTPPAWTHMTVRTGHGRSRHGLWRVYSAEDIGRGLPGGNKVKEMETIFEIIMSAHKAQDGPALAGGGAFHMTCQSGNAAIISESGSDPNCRTSHDRPVFEGDHGCSVLLRAFPRTGRTHQIRLHCQFLGLPLVGDVKYGGATGRLGPSADWPELAGHALHAESIDIRHPLTGERMLIHAPLPAWCSSAL